jgi:hypothetical protein
MGKTNETYLRYSNRMMYAELGSRRQIQRISFDNKNWTALTDERKKQLKLRQFAFGSVFPYIFDGLANAATIHLNEKAFPDYDDRYYRLEFPIDDLCRLSLMKEYQTHSREHFIHELLRFDETSDTDKDEAKYQRLFPLRKGNYLSAMPLKIKIIKKTPEELEGIKNLKTYSKSTKIIDTVIIYGLKLLISPIFPGYKGGWFLLSQRPTS